MPLFYYRILYYKIISMWFCNRIISHSSITYDILGKNVQIKTVNYYTHIISLPTTLKQVLFLPDPVYILPCLLLFKKKYVFKCICIGSSEPAPLKNSIPATQQCSSELYSLGICFSTLILKHELTCKLKMKIGSGPINWISNVILYFQSMW